MAHPDAPARADAVLAAALFALLLLATVVPLCLREDRATQPLAFPRHLVDLDSAPAGEIEALPGVGRVLASRIVAARAVQPFATVEDLRRVPGVGPTTLERLRAFARCGGP